MEPRKVDFSQLGWNSYQVNDIKIVFSLKTPEQLDEWAKSVGSADVAYASALVETYALEHLDQEIQTLEQCTEARAVLARFM
jgi:hypothetical protein